MYLFSLSSWSQLVWTSITSPIPFVSSSADSDSLNSTLKLEKSCYQMFKKKLYAKIKRYSVYDMLILLHLEK